MNRITKRKELRVRLLELKGYRFVRVVVDGQSRGIAVWDDLWETVREDYPGSVTWDRKITKVYLQGVCYPVNRELSLYGALAVELWCDDRRKEYERKSMLQKKECPEKDTPYPTLVSWNAQTGMLHFEEDSSTPKGSGHCEELEIHSLCDKVAKSEQGKENVSANVVYGFSISKSESAASMPKPPKPPKPPKTRKKTGLFARLCGWFKGDVGYKK